MKKIILFLLGILFVHTCYGQNLNLPSYVPPSPTATGLGRYGDIPVSVHTGIPNISIPLYTIQSGKLNLPISLSYHGSGLKAADKPTIIGYGWSLNAGGGITRAIQGIEDEQLAVPGNLPGRGFYNMILPDDNDPLLGEKEKTIFAGMSDYRDSYKVDGQPDLFYYNFFNESGKFILKNKIIEGLAPDFMTIPYSPIKIRQTDTFKEFTIIGADGTTYTFGQNNTGLGRTIDLTSTGSNPVLDKATAWHLTSVVSADKSDTITLKYQKHSMIEYRPKGVVLKKTINHEISADNYSYSVEDPRGVDEVTINDWLISEIIFKNGKVVFNHRDQPYATLSTLTIFSKENNGYKALKKFNLSQSDGFLDQVLEVGFDNGTEVASKPYKLSYFEKTNSSFSPGTGLAGRLKAQDYWGYYNGKNNDNLLMLSPPVPSVKTTLPPVVDLEKRRPDPTKMKVGILEMIQYPTGGKSIFEFEPNHIVQEQGQPTYTSVSASIVMGPVGYIQSDQLIVDDQLLQQNSGAGTYNVSLSIEGFLQCSSGSNCQSNSTTVELLDLTTGTVLYRDLLYDLEHSRANNERKKLYFTFIQGHIYKLHFPNGTGVSAGVQYKYHIRASLAGLKNGSPITNTSTVYTGGLRIKSIKSEDANNGSLIKEYKYPGYYFNSNLFNGNYETLSLQNYNFPKYGIFFSPMPVCGLDLLYYLYPENYPVALGGVSNNSISYSLIEEYQTDGLGNNLGKTAYKYNVATDIVSMRNVPLFKVDREFERGQLLEKQYYKFVNNEYSLIKKTVNTYVDVDKMLNLPADTSKFYIVYPKINWPIDVPAYMAANPEILAYGGVGGLTNPTYWKQNEYFVDKMYYTSPKLALGSTKEYDYFDEVITTSKVYDYTNGTNPVPSKISSIGSDGIAVSTNLKYVADFNSLACSNNAAVQLKTSLKALKDVFYSRSTAIRNRYDIYSQLHEFPVPGDDLLCQPLSRDSVVKIQAEYKSLLQDFTVATNATSALVNEYNQNLLVYQNCVNGLYTNASESQKAIMDMQRKNNIVPLITKDQYKNDRVISTELTEFKTFNEKLTMPIKLLASVSGNPVEVRNEFLRYDAYGNVLELRLDQGPKVCYVWSYEGVYPIAEIKNIDYSTIESLLGGPEKINSFSASIPTETQISAFLLPLKNSALLDRSQVNIYTYKPLVGLASQTDAKGMKTTYEYDSFSRLENIKDQNEDIVKNYRYNYADGSTPPVGTLHKNREVTIYKTRNNCGAGQQSVPIAHIVPANTYSSTESIDAADQMARIAEDAIAQAKANSLGVCTTPTPGMVSLSFSVPSQFNLKITNTATNIATDYIITGSNTITNIPSGMVNVTLTDDVPGGAVYSFNLNGEVKSGNSVTFSGVSFAVNATLTVTRTSSGSHYNTAFDIAKTKTNCPSGTGTSVNYPVAANLYTSAISVADANEKARIGEDARAQANANKLGGCTINGTTTYYSQLTLVTKTRNNCPNGVSGVPSEMSYPAGAYTSTISVADADQQLHAAAQQHANSTGGCAITSGTFSLNFVAPLSSHFSVHFKDVAGNTLRNLTIHGNHVINDLPGGTGSITIAPWPSPPDGLTFSYSVNGGTAQPTAPAQFTGVALSGTINVNVVQTRFANQVLTVAKTRNNCVNGEIGSSVNYIVPASTYWAASQTGADQLAQADANANAQNYANANGTCRDPFYSAELVVTKQKSCPVGQTGSSVAYTVPARKYTSTISQADADQKAQQDANNNAQNNANTLGACTVPTFTLNYSLPIHQQFTLILRNDYTNTPITYTISGSGTLVDIPGGSSYISIQPTTYMEGVDYTFNVGTYSPYSGTSYFTSGLPMLGTMQLNVTANQQIYYNVVATWKAVKACGYGFVGSEVTYTVPAGKYWSILGQSIADNQANEDSYTNAQAYANANGTCTPIYYSQALTIGKTRNNCAATYTGSLVYYYIQNGKYTSMISQADANQKAQADADANAQNYANTNGTCTPPVIYYSQPISVYKTKNNCPVGDVGGNVTYFVAPGKYTSLISQADADQQAQADFNANAQNYANANGTCTTPVFTLNYSVPDYAYFVVKLHNPTLGLTFYHTILGTGSLVNIRGGYGWDVEVYPDEAGNTSYHYSFLNGAATAFGTTASFNGLYFSGNVSLTVTQ